MSTDNTKLRTAIRFALGISAFALVPNVFAQDAEESANNVADDAEATLEEVIVTGSRIRRADIDSASPVTVINRADLEIQGLTDVGDLLQSIPSMSGSPIGTTTNNGGNGSVALDLRGMGSARTLTLVNGKRVVDGGDFQAIPSTMIERIEILKDGASAIYGADAVAGVVNIITRQDFSGIEVTAQTADWFDSKGQQDAYSLIAGQEFDRGNFVFGAEFVTQEAAFQSDVPWDYFQDSFYIYPEGCENQVAAPYDGTPTGGCYPLGSSRIPESRLTFANQGRFLIGTPATSPYEVGLMTPHDGRTYNYAPVNYMQTPYERTNIFGEAHFDVTDNVRFNMEFRGNFRESAQQLAPLPFTDSDPMWDGFYTDAVTGLTTPFHGISPDNYYLRRAVDAYNAATGSSLIYEPVAPRRRMIETNRRFEQEISQYQWTAGLEGEFNDDMNWEVFINEGHRARIDQDFGQFSGVRLANALGPSADLDGDGQPECYVDVNDPGTLIVGCVPLNLFGGGAVDAAGNPTVTTLTQDMLDYSTLNTVDAFKSRQRTAGASIAGSAFELPGGELGWAVGWSYWKQEFSAILDSAKTIGAVTGNVGANTQGTLTNNAVYAEFLAPMYDNGTQSISLKGGLRYDDWSVFGSDTTYQIGVEAQLMDNLKARATYGTVFRAPTIGALFGGQVDSFPQFNDPCAIGPGQALPPGCAQVSQQFDSQVKAKVGGNPFLEPETGDTLTAGLVWTPQFGDHNFTFIADYWQINLEDGIGSLGVQFTLDDCYINNNANACALVTRNPGADYTINQVLNTNSNLSTEAASGIDTEIRWDTSTDIGTFNAALLWTHNLENTISSFDGDPETEFVGRFTQGSAAFAEDKANFSIGWSLNDFSLSYLAEFIGEMDADTFCNCGAGNQADGSYTQAIDSELYHDLIGAYTFDSFGSETTITAGITNITDEAPPFIEVGFNGSTDPSTYRIFGTGYFLRLKWSY